MNLKLSILVIGIIIILIVYTIYRRVSKNSKRQFIVDDFTKFYSKDIQNKVKENSKLLTNKQIEYLYAFIKEEKNRPHVTTEEVLSLYLNGSTRSKESLEYVISGYAVLLGW